MPSDKQCKWLIQCSKPTMSFKVIDFDFCKVQQYYNNKNSNLVFHLCHFTVCTKYMSLLTFTRTTKEKYKTNLKSLENIYTHNLWSWVGQNKCHSDSRYAGKEMSGGTQRDQLHKTCQSNH